MSSEYLHSEFVIIIIMKNELTRKSITYECENMLTTYEIVFTTLSYICS